MSRLRHLSLPCLVVLASCATSTRDGTGSIGELRQTPVDLTDVKIDGSTDLAMAYLGIGSPGLGPDGWVESLPSADPINPRDELGFKRLVQLLPALAYLVFLTATGTSTLTGNGAGHVLLLASSGVVTCVPLLAFAVAAQALPLSILGLLQYLTPVAQFLLGVLWFHEAMPPYRWVGFALVWAALAVLTADALRHARRSQLASRATR